MNRILTIVCVAFWPFALLHAQDSRVDSLLSLTEVATDNELASTFYELSLSLQDEYPDSIDFSKPVTGGLNHCFPFYIKAKGRFTNTN